MKKTRWIDVPAGERLCVVAQGSPGAGQARELAESLMAHAAPTSVSSRDARGRVVTAACRDWREVEHLPEYLAPAILQATGLRPRFTGLICLDLRRCPGVPPAEALDELLALAAPLGTDVGLLLLCRGQAAHALLSALAPLEPMAEVLEWEEAYTTPQRLIGFAREEEM